MNNYKLVKNIFVEGNKFDYLNLSQSVIAYKKISFSLQKPLKLILLFGKPGSGKTFLLKKIHSDFSKKKRILFYPAPFFDEVEFLKSLYQDIFNKVPPRSGTYDEFLKAIIYGINKLELDPIPILIDEAQLYPQDLIEKIRLMADTRKFKFLFTVHKTDQEDILAKDYFKTRIWESIEIIPCTYPELKIYIEKKFLFHNFVGMIPMFKDKHLRFIFKYTKGNLRETNKFLYKLFELCEYYETHNPQRLNTKVMKMAHLEMIAIELGMIDA